MACEVLTVSNAGTSAVNGTYTQVPDEIGYQVWTHSSGNYAIVRLSVPGPPGQIRIASYPTFTGPGSTGYYIKTYIPRTLTPVCPAGETLNADDVGIGTAVITEGAPGPNCADPLERCAFAVPGESGRSRFRRLVALGYV